MVKKKCWVNGRKERKKPKEKAKFKERISWKSDMKKKERHEKAISMRKGRKQTEQKKDNRLVKRQIGNEMGW